MWLRSLFPKKCQHLQDPDKYLGATDNITVTTNQYAKENTAHRTKAAQLDP